MRLNILTLSTYDMCTTIISNCIQHVHKCYYKTKQCHGPIHQYIINYHRHIYLSFFPQSLILFVSPSLPPSLSPPSLSPPLSPPSLSPPPSPLSLLSPNYLRGGQGLHMTRWMHISRAITVGIILCHIIKTTAV